MYPVEIFIYCSNKSGSQTLLKTFEKKSYKVRHLHGANDFIKNKECGKYWTNFLKEKKTIFEWMDNSLLTFNKIYIIDSYRDPIERLVSHFFQSPIKNIKSKSISELIKIFNTEYLWTLPRVNAIDEVFHHYNIKNFDNFDFNKKYNIKEVNNKVFIKLRFKDINNWGQILSNIFGKNIKIENENLTKDKEIYQIYTQFKKEYKVPLKFLLYVINDTAFNIYNTPKDKYDYIKYWLNRLY
jgi:hypothetical protein